MLDRDIKGRKGIFWLTALEVGGGGFPSLTVAKAVYVTMGQEAE